MGTNYYVTPIENKLSEIPDTMVNEDGLIHVGKSSMGWCFSLHVYPLYDIMCFRDVCAFIQDYSAGIVDEYGDDVSYSDLIDVIVKRKRKPLEFPRKAFDLLGVPAFNNLQEFVSYHENKPHSCCFWDYENNLFRHRIVQGHCIGNGKGTYDYIIGEFC